MASEHDKRMAALDVFLDAYEAEYGQVTEEEMREATRALRRRPTIDDGTRDSQQPDGREDA